MRHLDQQIMMRNLERLRRHTETQQRGIGLDVRQHVRDGGEAVEREDQGRHGGRGDGGVQWESEVGIVEDEERFALCGGRGS
jgi:hypothetical protein